MDFSLSAEQQLIQTTAQRFADSELSPHAAAFDRHQQRPVFLSKLKALAELGFMGLTLPAEDHGGGADTVSFSLAITELAKGCASVAVTTSVNNMVAELVHKLGSAEQKATFLPPLLQGHYPAAAFCLTEASAGSDPAAMQTRATPVDGGWQLNGTKLYITSAAYAGFFVVWAVTDTTAAKGKGISCFLVPADSDGVSIGKEESKMGQRGSATNEVLFNDCFVPTQHLLGQEHQGFRIAVSELAGGRIGIGSLALGLGEAALDYARRFIQERAQFGQPIAHFQGPQWVLAERYTELTAARQLLMRAAWLKDQGQPFATEASMAKLFASEKANRACYDALQLLGGAGYVTDHPVERWARDVRITSIYEGTSEIQKIIIARHLLG